VKNKNLQVGCGLLVAGIVLWDLSRDKSFLRAAAGQISSVAINDILSGLMA